MYLQSIYSYNEYIAFVRASVQMSKTYGRACVHTADSVGHSRSQMAASENDATTRRQIELW